MGIAERGLAPHDRHVVAPELILDDDLLTAEYLVDLGEELLRGGAGAGRCPGPIMAGDPIEEEHGLAPLAENDEC